MPSLSSHEYPITVPNHRGAGATYVVSVVKDGSYFNAYLHSPENGLPITSAKGFVNEWGAVEVLLEHVVSLSSRLGGLLSTLRNEGK